MPGGKGSLRTPGTLNGWHIRNPRRLWFWGEGIEEALEGLCRSVRSFGVGL
jgi:hypothetical protein